MRSELIYQEYLVRVQKTKNNMIIIKANNNPFQIGQGIRDGAMCFKSNINYSCTIMTLKLRIR